MSFTNRERDQTSPRTATVPLNTRLALIAHHHHFFFSPLIYDVAPKPVTRHLVVSARPAKPTRPDAAATAFENPKREAYPDEVLTHRFRAYGDPGDRPPEPEHHMDVDTAEVSAKEKKERHKRKGGGETGSSKRKKAKLVAS